MAEHRRLPSSGVTGAPATEANEPKTSVSLLASRFTQGPNVHVAVGRGRQAFQINRELLIHKSPYLAAKLNDSSDDGDVVSRDSIELPDLTVGGFEVFVDWIYAGRLPEYITQIDPQSGEWVWRWYAAYKAADTLAMHSLQNELIDLDIRTCTSQNIIHSTESLINCAKWDLVHTPYYKLALRNSTRDFVRTPQSDEICDSWTNRLTEHVNIMKDFTMHVNRYHRKPWTSVSVEDACNYHVHSNGERCLSHSSRKPKREKSAEVYSTTNLPSATNSVVVASVRPKPATLDGVLGMKSPPSARRRMGNPPEYGETGQSATKDPKSRGSRRFFD